MKVLTKIMIAAAGVLLLGIILVAVAFGMADFNYKNIGTREQKVQKHYECTNSVTEIVVGDSNTSVIVKSGAVDAITLDYWENTQEFYNISENENTITVQKECAYKWYDNIMVMDMSTYNCTVTVPETFDGRLNIKTSNASMEISDVCAQTADFKDSNSKLIIDSVTVSGDCDVENANGRIEITESDFGSLSNNNSNASITLDEVEVAEELRCDSSNGKIELRKASAERLVVDNSNSSITLDSIEIKDEIILTDNNGSIHMYDVTGNDISADTSNAKIELDDVDVKSQITCKNSNGSITGSIVGSQKDFNINADTSNGSSNISDCDRDADKKLKAKTSNASIDITFTED